MTPFSTEFAKKASARVSAQHDDHPDHKGQEEAHAKQEWPLSAHRPSVIPWSAELALTDRSQIAPRGFSPLAFAKAAVIEHISTARRGPTTGGRGTELQYACSSISLAARARPAGGRQGVPCLDQAV